MLIPFRPGPHRRERHHVREVERRDRRLADVGVDVAGQAAEPCLDRVHGLAHAGEVAALDGLLDQPQPILGDAGILVPDGDGRRDIGLADEIGAEFLERGVGVERLVGGVAVHQHRRLVGHHLLQDRHDRLALGEPLAADPAEHLRRIRLVETDRARRPAIGKGEPVEIVEQARPGLRREAHDGEGAQMRAAEPRLEAAGQILVDQDGVEMHRRLGHAHALAAGRNAGMQVGQRLGIIEPLGLGHEAFDQREHPVGAVDESGQRRAPIGAILRAVLIEPGLGAGGVIGRRQPEQRQEIAALEMGALFLELRAALGVDETGGGVGKLVPRIAAGGLALRLDEDRPARSQTTQRDC